MEFVISAGLIRSCVYMWGLIRVYNAGIKFREFTIRAITEDYRVSPLRATSFRLAALFLRFGVFGKEANVK